MRFNIEGEPPSVDTLKVLHRNGCRVYSVEGSDPSKTVLRNCYGYEP